MCHAGAFLHLCHFSIGGVSITLFLLNYSTILYLRKKKKLTPCHLLQWWNWPEPEHSYHLCWELRPLVWLQAQIDPNSASSTQALRLTVSLCEGEIVIQGRMEAGLCLQEVQQCIWGLLLVRQHRVQFSCSSDLCDLFSATATCHFGFYFLVLPQVQQCIGSSFCQLRHTHK